MRTILFLGLPFLLENVYFIRSIRKFYMQPFICKLLPAVFTNLLKIICSSLLSKKKNRRMYFHILILAVIFEMYACTSAFHSAKITGIYHAVALNSKVIFVALLAYFMLKKRFSYLQIIGQCIIFAGICWGGCNTKNIKDKSTLSSAISFCAIVFTGLMSSLGNVYFEKYVRSNIVDFHTYNLQYSITHVLISMFTAATEIYIQGKQEMITTVSNFNFYNYIIISVLHTYILTYISTKVEPIIRSFMILIISNVTSIIIEYIELQKIDTRAFITLAIVNFGIILYEMNNIKKLVNKIMKSSVTPKKEKDGQ